VDKRLPLFLFLSFLIVIAWPRPGADPEAGDGADAPPADDSGFVADDSGFVADDVPPLTTSQPGAGAQPDVDDPSPELIEPESDETGPQPGAPAAWRETLKLGRAGEPGHYLATFDNRGAVLCDLRLDGYYTSMDLDSAGQADPANWVTLLEEVENQAGWSAGPDQPSYLASLDLRTSASSQPLAPLGLDAALWEAEILRNGGVTAGVRFTHDPGHGVRFVKTVRSIPGSYLLDFALSLEATSPGLAGRSVQFTLTPAMGVPRSASDSFYTEPKAGVCWGRKGEFEVEREARVFDRRVDGERFPPQRDIAWAGVDSKYFAVLLMPLAQTSTGVVGASWRTVFDEGWARENPEEFREGYRHVVTDIALLVPLPREGEATELSFQMYAGPKNKRALEQNGGEALMQLAAEDLGFFDGIAGLLLRILGFFHGISGNWGWSIILLTLFVRAALFPFNRRSQTAMARHATKMKRVQPKLNEVKERYKKDPQKLRSEQARIMQEEGAFPPLGGCLPIFVQIPIFFGLFSALRTSFDLRQAPFMGWIHDLSEPDRFMRIDLDLPIIGTIEYLNVLPPLMVVLWILQQRVMPKPTDPQAQRMQKMMMFMPILFGFFLYNYAAGLSLYMITTSLFGVIEQTVIKKIWPIDDAEQKKKKGGFMSRLGDLQKEAQKIQEMKRKERGSGGGKGKGKGKGPGKGPGKGKKR